MVSSVISNVVVMVIYMCIGYIVCKSGLGEPSHAKTLSGILIYILGPLMIINAFINTEYTLDTFIKICQFFFITLAVQLLFFILLYLLFHKRYSDSRFRIASIGGVLGNVGFLGMPILVGMFPEYPVVACFSSINVMSMNLLVFTVGSYMITGDKKYISVKSALLNPTTISLIFALPLFLLQIKLPVVATDCISTLAKMVVPFCMIILGMRLSTADFKVLFTQKIVYLTCFLKLIVFPVFAFLLVKFIPFIPDYMKICVFVLAAVPSGAIIQSLAEIYECQQEFSANVVLLTTLLSVITIPLMVSFL